MGRRTPNKTKNKSSSKLSNNKSSQNKNSKSNDATNSSKAQPQLLTWQDSFLKCLSEIENYFNVLDGLFHEAQLLEIGSTHNSVDDDSCLSKFGRRLGDIDRIDGGLVCNASLYGMVYGVPSVIDDGIEQESHEMNCKTLRFQSQVNIEEILCTIKVELLGELEHSIERGITKTNHLNQTKDPVGFGERMRELDRFQSQFELTESLCRSLDVNTIGDVLGVYKIILKSSPFL